MEKIKLYFGNPKMRLSPKGENIKYHWGFNSNIVFMNQRNNMGLFFLKKKIKIGGLDNLKWVFKIEDQKLLVIVKLQE